MKTKSNRRGRRQRGYRGLLWVLAAGLLLFGLIAQQNILLGTSSRHALLMDARTGQVLARKRSGEEAAPASLTKMMTVLLVTEALPDLDTPVTLPEDIFPALYKADASMAGFQPGETVTVRDLLYGAMLPSGAECCEALARQVSGNEEAFVALMNRKAGELGMKHTHFANCTGLTSPEHYSSAAAQSGAAAACTGKAVAGTVLPLRLRTALAAPAGSQPARSESRLGKTDGLPAKAKRAIKIIDGTVLNNR